MESLEKFEGWRDGELFLTREELEEYLEDPDDVTADLTAEDAVELAKYLK